MTTFKQGKGGLFNQEPPEAKHEASALSREDTIEALNQWGSAGIFRSKGVGNRIHICNIVGHPCRVVSLKTHYERRSEKTVIEPYRNGSVDNHGRRPGMWDIKVPKPDAFVEGLYEQVIPHTDKVEKCGNCGGCGRVNCGGCFGSGKVGCSTCAGSGSITQLQTVWKHEWRDGQSHSYSTTESVRALCTTCHGGMTVTCSSCAGSGRNTCGRCSGYGQLKSYQFLTVVFPIEELKSVVESPDALKDSVIKVTGAVIYEREEEEISSALDIGQELHSYAASLLRQVEGSSGKILRQRLMAEVIPVTEAIYKRRLAGKEKSLWIYGKERQVLGDRWLLTNWLAIFGVAAVGSAVVGAIGMMVIPSLPGDLKLDHSPNQPELVTPTPDTSAPAIGEDVEPSIEPNPSSTSGEASGEENQNKVLPQEEPSLEQEPSPSNSESGSETGGEPRKEESQPESIPPLPVAPEAPSVPSTPETPPPAPVKLSAVGAAQCQEFSRIAEPKHAFLTDFQSNVVGTALQPFPVESIEDERAGLRTYLGFLNKHMSELDATAKDLRAMQVTDERIDLIRTRYAGAVEEGVASLSSLRDVLVHQSKASDEEFHQEVDKIQLVLSETNDRGDFVQREVGGMMQDATTYCSN